MFGSGTPGSTNSRQTVIRYLMKTEFGNSRCGPRKLANKLCFLDRDWNSDSWKLEATLVGGFDNSSKWIAHFMRKALSALSPGTKPFLISTKLTGGNKVAFHKTAYFWELGENSTVPTAQKSKLVT